MNHHYWLPYLLEVLFYLSPQEHREHGKGERETYGLSGKLASVGTVDIPVHKLHRDNERTARALFEERKKAQEEEGAEVIILGCTGMTGMAERLSKERGVQVIDPLPSAVKFAKTLVSLGLSHSKFAFPTPPEKER